MVHRLIQFLEKPTNDGRRFYLKTLPGAQRTWFRRWHEALEQNAQRLIEPNEESAKKYGEVGVICIVQYWKANISTPRPLEVERHYYLPQTAWGFPAEGYADQIRAVSLEWIRTHRPELVVGGRLADGYDPVVIVDVKTSSYSYDVSQFLETATPEELVRRQYPLLMRIQQTFYTWLYHQTNGRKPVGCLWCHLRSGKVFPTYPDEPDYLRLFEIITHAIGVLESNVEADFPRNQGPQCRWCDFFCPCCPPDVTRIVAAENFEQAGRPQLMSLPEPPGRHEHQLAFAFPRPRRQSTQGVLAPIAGA